ncbi:hypothetical protein IPJ91_00670 [bacterium]|nr:MAG: hypothetical protein IPJ91_00670 [bacterium]
MIIKFIQHNKNYKGDDNQGNQIESQIEGMKKQKTEYGKNIEELTKAV